jgi:phosphodiesterase/alkaline phosphatase D-like protein
MPATRSFPSRYRAHSSKFNKNKVVFKKTVKPSSKDDRTVKALAAGLEPDTSYFFRWRKRSGSRTSEIGTFTTSPEPTHTGSL